MLIGLQASAQDLADQIVNIEDLEEIPRDEWPDLSRIAESQATRLGSGSPSSDELYSPFDRYVDSLATGSVFENRDDPDWSPFVVNGLTYKEYTARRATDRLLEAVQSDQSNVCRTCID